MIQLKPKTKVTITLESKRQSQDNLVLQSTFECNLDENHFLVAAPFHKQALYPLHVGELVYFTYLDAKSRLDFQGVVKDRFKRDDQYYLTISRTTDVVKTQRRQDFRLELTMDLDLEQTVINEMGVREIKILKARMADISSGGAAIRLNEHLFFQEKLSFLFPIREKFTPLRLNCEVRWISLSNYSSVYKYLCGVRFVFDNKRDREVMIKYLFEIQQQRMRLGS